MAAGSEEVPPVKDGDDAMTTEAVVARPPPPPPPSSWPPAVAARYTHAVLVGRGMFGKVYAAWDTIGERLVAVKQLSGRTDAEFVATGAGEFAQEVAALKACRGHPNVVKLLDTIDDCGTGTGTGYRFIVTKFAGSTNLRRYVDRRRAEGRPFGEAEVRDAVAQILAAVMCAHDAGVVHREVVSENVIVDDDDDDDDHDQKPTKTTTKKRSYKRRYTLCGFNASERAGLAAQDGSAQLASASPYRAPELFLGPGVAYNDRMDTWGVGCVMAELLASAGVSFFGSDDAHDRQGLKGVLQVVGGKGFAEWAGSQRAPAAQEDATCSKIVDEYSRDAGRLRVEFPKKKLSRAGFDVLSGLLQSNPDRRLTAAAALQMPWFRRRRSFVPACFS